MTKAANPAPKLAPLEPTSAAPATSATLSGVGRGDLLRGLGDMFITDDGLARIQSGFYGSDAFQADEVLSDQSGVAIIKIHGAIASRSCLFTEFFDIPTYEDIEAALELSVEDESIEAIILDIDSPGGSAAGNFALADAVAAACEKKRIIAHSSSYACSAAYLIASACDEVHGTPGSVWGSIGARATHYDQSRFDEAMGLKVTHVVSGKNKTEGDPHSPLSEEHRQAMQARVDRLARMFIERVAKWRGLSEQSIRDLEAGVLLAEDALSVGLVDSITSLSSLIRGMSPQEGAGMPAKKPKAAEGDTMQAEPAAVEMQATATVIEDTLEAVSTSFPAAVAAIQAAAIEQATMTERDRVNAINAHTASGHEALAAAHIKDGKSELEFLRAQAIAERQDAQAAMAAIQAAEQEPQASASASASMAHELSVEAIKLDRGAGKEQIEAAFNGCKQIRDTFLTIDTFAALVRAEGFKQLGR